MLQQQAVLGRAEQQVEDYFPISPGRDLTPHDGPIEHDPVLAAQRLEDTFPVARGEVLVVLGLADEVTEYPPGRGARHRADPRPQFGAQVAAERPGVGQWLLLLELSQERVQRKG